jgi:hypothetical protein
VAHRARWFALPLLATGILGVAIAACSDKDEDPPATSPATQTGTASPGATTPATSGTNSPVEPIAAAPVSQFIVLVQDLGIDNFLTDLETTSQLTTATYAATTTFAGAADGAAKLDSWGYVEGYRTGLIPEGGASAMNNGGYVLYEELHLYDSTDGAHEAFLHLAGNVRGNSVAEVITGPSVANESITSRAVAGKVAGTNVDQVLHQVIFRRGNVVAVVLTIGAEPLMESETAIEIAQIIDAKILDERDHPQPTPIPARSPSPSATATP